MGYDPSADKTLNISSAICIFPRDSIIVPTLGVIFILVPRGEFPNMLFCKSHFTPGPIYNEPPYDSALFPLKVQLVTLILVID